MAHPLPSEYTFGKVVGRAVHAIADTAADEDHLPEARPAVGRVVFRPKTSLRKAVADYSAFVIKGSVTANLDELGRIIDAEGRLGIWLVTGHYDVTFSLADGQIPGFTIEVTDAHTDESPLDLVTAAPPQPGPGITVQTMIVPSGAALGQVLGWTPDGIGWIDPEVAGDVSPEVIAARDAAVSAAGSAQASATAANLSALDAEGSATSAAGSASTASAAVGSIGTSVADAEAAATHAGAARDAAVVAQGAAETARDEAVAAAGEAGGGAGMPAGMVPIFQSLTDAQDWETANPGRTALWIDTSEDPGGTYNDHVYQWLGKDAGGATWVDTVQGFELTKQGTGVVTVSGGVATFPGGSAAYWADSLPLLTGDETTDLWVFRTLETNDVMRGLGGYSNRTIASPGGGKALVSGWLTGNNGPLNPRPPLDDQWHIVVARWSPSGTVITIDDTSYGVTAATFGHGAFAVSGTNPSGTLQHFKGEIREARFWNRRLTDDELAGVITETRGVYGL